MTDRPAPTGSGIPVLGGLSRAGRVAFVVVVGLGLTTIAVDLFVHLAPTLTFALAAVSILGLAWLIGQATERIGAITGPQIGGILNATFGNVAELIIAFFALQAGLIDVVKASLTGSIIGNLLLVLGVSVLVGGLRHGTQSFSERIAGANASLLVVAVIGLFVPAVFALTTSDPGQGSRTEESVVVAFALIAGYVLSLVYAFRHPADTLGGHGEPTDHGGPAWSARTAVVVLVVAAGFLAFLSEVLVGSI